MNEEKINLSEAIALAKQKENEIFRLAQLRKAIIAEPFRETEYLGKKEEISPEEYQSKVQEFTKEKKQKLADLNDKISERIEGTILLRNLINKKNVEIGLDRKLIEMKWLRIQLDHLMKTLKLDKTKSYVFNDGYGIDGNLYLDLKLGDELEALETRKNKLDSEIQKLNQTTKIVINR